MLCLLVLCACSLPAGAQTFTAPDPGPGVVPIKGTWQFHTGDDLAWADPNFDDEGWQAIRTDEGWGAQGHVGYAGYAWYRKRIAVSASDEQLGILIPRCYGAYEVYWNGRRIGNTGNLPPHAAWYAKGQDAVFALTSGGSRQGVLALRFWRAPLSTSDDPETGGFRFTPQLGHFPLLQQQLQLSSLRREHLLMPVIIPGTLLSLGAVASLLFFLRDRRKWLFLWISLLLGGSVLTDAAVLIDRRADYSLVQSTIQFGIACTDVGLWLTLLWFFGLHRSKYWRVMTIGVVALYLVAQAADTFTIYLWPSAGPGSVSKDRTATQVYTACQFFVLFLVVAGFVREKALSLRILGAIAAVYGSWQPVLVLIGLVSPAVADRMGDWHLKLGDYDFSAFALLRWLLVITLWVAVILRQLEEGRRQTHLEAELRSAQEIQQILIPEEIPSIPGLAVDSVYKPAAEVGGDFFQVIPPDLGDPDEGTLIIVGDVSGKGLKAAMTVSLIVGTLRTLADATRSPAAILAGLNRRLLGRTQGGFATCLVLRMDADGTATLANAGHLSPFLDGVEWDVPASLPLGLVAEADYDEVHTRLGEGETLTLITDGVLEARNREGELYGFDRVAGLMRTRPSAEHVAEAACAFGQDDDITVLSVTREAVRQPAPVLAAARLAPAV